MIAAEGVNSSGLKMVVRKVLEGVPRPLCNSPAHKIREYHHDGLYQVCCRAVPCRSVCHD